ncbi:MAG: hypothetical protein EBR45_09470, partial [Betaproteobacteria bacterium]|nr:hypothetical protein [Betaproteobacteria bacterium]
MTAGIHPFPWHEGPLRRWLASRLRLPHALLVTAALGTGALEFGRALAGGLLCEGSTSETVSGACGSCPACQWMQAGNHPDFRFVGLDGDAGTVGDSLTVRGTSSTTLTSNTVNPSDNVMNSSVSQDGARSPYLTGSSIGRSKNTFGVEADL